MSCVSPSSSVEVVEMKIEHSKTGFSRYIDMAGTTTGTGIQVAAALRSYWRVAGFKLKDTYQAGIRVTSPDYWVVRVSLLGPSVDLARLESALKSYPDPEVRVAAGPAMNKAAGRLRMSGPDSLALRIPRILRAC